MLIGRNLPTAFQPLNVIYGREEKPWAEEYKFCWKIIGNFCTSRATDSNQTQASSVQRLTTQEEVKSKDSIYKSKDMKSPQQLQQMTQLDYNELHYSRRIHGTGKLESLDDKRFRENMEKRIHQNDNGNWEAPIPFKTDDVSLPNNQQQCLPRPLSLKRKLNRDGKTKQAHSAFMQKLSAQELLNNPRWLKGPEFLWEAEVPLINKSGPKFEVADDGIELKVHLQESQTTTLITAKTKDQHPTVLQYIERFSNWHKAKLWISTIRRVINRLKKKSTPVDILQSDINPLPTSSSVRDLQAAEHLIIKSQQEIHLKDEISILKQLQGNTEQFKDRNAARARHTHLKASSSLYRLDLFIDQAGILRVGGRISTTDEPFAVKHPLILPQRSHVTSLIINHYHSEVIHRQGRGATLNSQRQSGFWITNGRSAVTSHISKCVKCHKERGKFLSEKMADLPEERVTPAPPFTYSGMDVIGSFYIKEGRKTLKRYGIIFTCQSSRSVHLETLNSMDTDSFINAVRRFLSRRGKVQVLRCDQGTNFVGTKNKFIAAQSEVNEDKVKEFLLKIDCELIEFKFNVPHASHMGEVWERMIRSIRAVLSSLLNKLGTQLDDEALRTLMTETENIINSRPLTVAELSDASAAEPLTPNHFLIGKSSVVFTPPGNFESADVYCRKRWRRVQFLAN